MQDLIPITQNSQGQPAVSGRELHEFLEVTTRYNDWFSRSLEYGFENGIDYQAITQKRVTAQGEAIAQKRATALLVAQKRATNNLKNPWTEITDHALSLDMLISDC